MENAVGYIIRIVFCLFLQAGGGANKQDADRRLPAKEFPQLTVRSIWLDLHALKIQATTDLLPGPNAIVALRDGSKYPNFQFRQGNINEDPRKDFTFVSSGSIKIEGTGLPCLMHVSYEYRNNQGTKFSVESKLKILNKRGDVAIRTNDNSAALILIWEPQKKT